MIGEGHCVLPAVTRQPQFENQVEIILLFHYFIVLHRLLTFIYMNLHEYICI